MKVINYNGNTIKLIKDPDSFRHRSRRTAPDEFDLVWNNPSKNLRLLLNDGTQVLIKGVVGKDTIGTVRKFDINFNGDYEQIFIIAYDYKELLRKRYVYGKKEYSEVDVSEVWTDLITSQMITPEFEYEGRKIDNVELETEYIGISVSVTYEWIELYEAIEQLLRISDCYMDTYYDYKKKKVIMRLKKDWKTPEETPVLSKENGAVREYRVVGDYENSVDFIIEYESEDE